MKKKFLDYEKQIRYIQAKFRQSVESEHNKFELLIRLWKNLSAELYNSYKSMKTKKSVLVSKKIICIKETERNAILQEELKKAKKEYVIKYLEWEKFQIKKVR